MQNIDIQIVENSLDLDFCRSWVTDPACGAEVLFIGTVRNHTSGRDVLALDFECYQTMAIKEMKKIAEFCVSHLGVTKILIHHRTGYLKISDIPVIIAVSSAHRAKAFEACQYAIDNLKKTVPIWKKEIFTDGESWVSPTP
jgi:molybdopterin synthase catalytic subunit